MGGTLTSSIGIMGSLQEIMLYSNKLTGTIPSEIGILRNLSHFSLAFNKFKGSIPQEISQLGNLAYLHLHSNLLDGEAHNFPYKIDSYITDCGGSLSTPALVTCQSCTYCCNVLKECINQEIAWPPDIFRNLSINAPFLVMLVVGCSLIAFFAFCLILKFTMKNFLPTPKHVVRDKFQENSVYKFFLTKNWIAWLLALLIMLLHMFTLRLFLRAADSTSDGNDFAFYFTCPTSSLGCMTNTAVTTEGWVVFVLLLCIFLLPDIIDALCLMYESITIGDTMGLVAGTLVMYITVLSGVISYLFNNAVGTNNTAILVDCAVLLFLNDIDEKLLEILSKIFPDWVDEIDETISEYSSFLEKEVMFNETLHEDEAKVAGKESIRDEIDTLQSELKAIKQLLNDKNISDSDFDDMEDDIDDRSSIGLFTSSSNLDDHGKIQNDDDLDCFNDNTSQNGNVSEKVDLLRPEKELYKVDR